MATKLKIRNYSVMEKQLFVKILQKYSHIVESKKSSASNLQDKEEAWEAIVEEFNSSSIVAEPRSVKQLKKLWTNLKQAQRDALTKEKQSCFLTGGGPPSPSVSVDPQISMIVPNLMTAAPAMFSSSFDEKTLKQRENQVTGGDTDSILLEILDEAFTDGPSEDAENCATQDTGLLIQDMNDASEMGHGGSQISQPDEHIVKKRPSTSSSTSTVRKSRKTSTTHELDEKEEELKVRRLQSIIKQESEIYSLKKRHEEELHEIALAKSAFDLRAAKANAELAELRLAKENSR